MNAIDPFTQFRARLRIAVKQCPLSQRDACLRAGVGYGSLQSWLSGRQRPRLDLIACLAPVLGTTVSWLCQDF